MKTGTPTPSGLILLHKQPGCTSFDSLRDIKRMLNTGKAGHTGTLDKFAEGLLLVLTGKALKLSRWFTHCDKQYEGTICFGTETDTLDPEGRPIAHAPPPSREAVEQALVQFRGAIEQVPPAYSAIHIDGERASTLARRGQAPAMRKRSVHIYRLELRSWDPPFARIFVHCSSGTYIRSLARDIALASGSRAHLSALTRTRVAGFTLDRADSARLLPIDTTVFNNVGIPWFTINPAGAEHIAHGKALSRILHNVAPVLPDNPLPREVNAAAIFAGDTFIAMAEQVNGTWKYGYVNARD